MDNSLSGNNSPYNSFSIAPIKKSGLSDFLESNSLIARIAFILLVLFGFVLALQLGTYLLTLFFTNDGANPHLFNGMVDGKQLIVFPQDPKTKGAKTILRSINENAGVEFTWSVWIFIENLQYNSGKYRHIFHKGNVNPSPDDNGLNFPNNAPGLYIAPTTTQNSTELHNNLVVIMNTYSTINEEVTINDVPLNKWVNVIIRCRNKSLDIYINGTITKSTELMGVPKQNYGDVYVAMNGGFAGYISNLWYYNYALGTTAIQNIVQRGPNTKMADASATALAKKDTNYLSLRWYFYGNN